MRHHTAVSLLLVVSFLTACGGGKGVYGTVTDGEPLPGARVELLSCNVSGCNDEVASQITASDGRYSFPDAGPGKYMLTITWENSPACPGIQPSQTLGTSGEFLVTYAGYVGLGGTGNRSIFAVKEFELKEGQSIQLDLKFACPD
jgi:hypothetical protein